MTTDPFSPNIGTGVWESQDSVVDGIRVPLMLCRSVAELPDPTPWAEAIAHLAERIRQSTRDIVYTIASQGPGCSPGIIIYPNINRFKVIGYDATLTSTAGTAVMLTPNGLHLLHGQLVFFVHHLARRLSPKHPYPEAPPAVEQENADVAAVRDALIAQVDAADTAQRVKLFASNITDMMGRPVTLEGIWYPNIDVTSWEWTGRNDGLSGSIYFPLTYAAHLAGLLTILRLARPEWSWQEK